MENLISTAGQYGVLGLTLLASFWYIQKKDSEHKDERSEMNQRFENQHNEIVNVTERNTTALVELVTIIKNK